MARQRNHYTADFKAKVALAAIKGQQTVNEIAATYGVHPNQVLQWKRQALEVLPDVFSSRRARAAQDDEALQARLYQQIGQLKVELDWLKKKVGLPAWTAAAMGRTAPRTAQRAAAMPVARGEPR
jgi:transposase-like protein